MIYVDIEKKLGKFLLKTKFSCSSNIMGLLGASGSGKSLTLKCIAGIEKPDKGKIILNGRVLFDSEKNINIAPKNREVGYMFQNYALFPNMNVYENVLVGIRDKKIDKEKIILEKLDSLKILHLKDKKIFEISGGEAQRVALCRILVNQPKIILLDEPFSALDDFLKWKIELEVLSILEKYKIPSILVSHSREEVYRLCKDICVMNKGKSEEILEKKELFKNPKTFAASLISGCKNFSKIKKISQNKVKALDFGIVLDVLNFKDSYDMVAIRSHFVQISNDSKDGFEVYIDRVIEDIFSYIVMVRFKAKEDSSLRIDIDKEKWENINQNEKLYVRLEKEHLILLSDKEV